MWTKKYYRKCHLIFFYISLCLFCHLLKEKNAKDENIYLEFWVILNFEKLVRGKTFWVVFSFLKDCDEVMRQTCGFLEFTPMSSWNGQRARSYFGVSGRSKPIKTLNKDLQKYLASPQKRKKSSSVPITLKKYIWDLNCKKSTTSGN